MFIKSFPYPDKQGTPEERRRIQRPKRCITTNNKEDEDNSPKNKALVFISYLLFHEFAWLKKTSTSNADTRTCEVDLKLAYSISYPVLNIFSNKKDLYDLLFLLPQNGLVYFLCCLNDGLVWFLWLIAYQTLRVTYWQSHPWRTIVVLFISYVRDKAGS